MTDLLIEGPSDELELIRREIEREVGRSAELEPVMSTGIGEMREPILISLIVALGGPAVTAAIVKIIKRHYDYLDSRAKEDHRHAEAMADLSLKLLEGDEERSITLSELAGA